MKHITLQTITFCALALSACRTEPTRGPESKEQPLAPGGANSPPASAAPASAAPASGPPASAAPANTAAATSLTRTFDEEASDAPPPGFTFGLTGKGVAGKWLVKPSDAAPSQGKMLAQLDADSTNFRFPLAVANEPVLKDVRVSVRCKLISGRVDQACGLVARYRDENNYFITRANALEDNIRLYSVREGKRTELASHDIEVTPNTWHEYRLEVRGDHLQVFWDGQRVIDHHDGTFAEAGRVGVWTKADSVTYFDDLRAEALP